MSTASTGSSPGIYVAVLIYESSSNVEGYAPLYEESFVLIKAASEEEARAKAEARGAGEQVRYRNEKQDTISWSLKHVIDVASVLDEELGDGSELYARHFRNYEAYRAFEPLLAGEV